MHLGRDFYNVPWGGVGVLEESLNKIRGDPHVMQHDMGGAWYAGAFLGPIGNLGDLQD